MTTTPNALTPATLATTTPAPGTPTLGTGRGVLTNRGATLPVASGAVALRTLKKFVRTPQLVVAGTLSGAMFLLIFRYVFGGAVSHLGGMSYVDFVIPGFVVTSVLFTGMGSATGVAEDLSEGLVDRLRSLPIPPLAIVCGRILADTTMVAWSLAVTAGIGFVVGFRVHGGIGQALGAFGLCVIWGFAFCWMFVGLGFLAGNAQAAQSLSFLVFPLTFVSSAYVPVSTMPAWMRAFANHQPITAMTDTARILTGGHGALSAVGHSLGGELWTSLLWSAAIVAAFAPLTVWRLRHS